MTKEELRKEVEEWLSITDNHLNDERTHFLSESEYAEQAYLAGAEPREKRIEDLEKENAKLKETVIKMNNVITETFSNLTKAKELLRQFLNAKNGEDTYKAEWETEQFLSEVEK